ncbi:hypothetical protein A2G94_06545 [Francisella endosymbiont of Ornithodoros moubata]|nr:hypothetical protein A2G94_06545 [Francisella endosymbiont of Ornithodoros moubata]
MSIKPIGSRSYLTLSITLGNKKFLHLAIIDYLAELNINVLNFKSICCSLYVKPSNPFINSAF